MLVDSRLASVELRIEMKEEGCGCIRLWTIGIQDAEDEVALVMHGSLHFA